MKKHLKLVLVLSIVLPFLLLLSIFLLICALKTKRIRKPNQTPENPEPDNPEQLMVFEEKGREEFTVHDILDAPGEVVGRCSYGTLYRAEFLKYGSVMLLRFVRPGCCVDGREDADDAVRVIGSVRHPNLVPLRGVYVGPRGERLFVFPYYLRGSLRRFLKDETPESKNWVTIHKITLGIARGLDHLHDGLQSPIIHGSLKTKNIFIDVNNNPVLSEFGLQLILNPTCVQEILEDNAFQGYKAPELIKNKDLSKEADIYSLGIIFLEILTRKEQINLLEISLENKNLEEGSGKLFDLAMACCSSSPVLRPDIKYIVKKLEEL